MRRFSSVLVALTIVGGIAGAASAQTELALWFDSRDNSINTNNATNYNALTEPVTMTGPYLNDTVNGGKRGANQTLRLDSVHADSFQTGLGFANLDGDGNRATGNLWLYGDMSDDAGSLGANDVEAAIGIDFNVTANSTPVRNTIASLDWAWNNDQTVGNSSLAPGGTGPWNGTANGSMVAGSPPSWTGAKAVAVPVTSGPLYSTVNRMVPGNPSGTRAYRLGRLRVTAGSRACSGVIGAPDFNYNNRSTYNVMMKTNNLLIARVFSSGGDAVENVSFGYNGAALDAPVNGSSQGNMSAVVDAVITVRMKGDFTGDGRVTSADNTAYFAAVADTTDNELQAYLGDFTTQLSAATIGNLVTSADNTGYFASIGLSTTCP